MSKIDYKKEYKELYSPTKKDVSVVSVPEMNFLMIDGQGDPNTSEAFKDATEALYSLSYTIKFMIKQGAMAIDYGVLPLEGLWWADDMETFDIDNKQDWKWTLMIMQPNLVSKELVKQATDLVRYKSNPAALSKIRFESYDEGEVAQIMHLGPFSEEGPAVEKVHEYIASQGFKRNGKHHEIYLSDIRKAAPEKWRTVIRQPFV